RFVGDMGDVHEDTLAIHLADDFLAEIGEAVVNGLVGGGIGPLVVIEVRERDVADAEIAEHAQDTDVVADHVTALDADQDGDLTLGVRAANVVGGAAENKIVRMLLHVFADRVDLVERFLDGGWPEDAAVDPHREKLDVEAALAHARDIHMTVGVALAEIKGLREEALRRVRVRVKDDRGKMELAGMLRNIVGGYIADQEGSSEEAKTET